MFQGFGPKLVPSCKPLGEKLFLTKKTYLAFKLVSSWSHGTLRNAKSLAKQELNQTLNGATNAKNRQKPAKQELNHKVAKLPWVGGRR